MNERIPVTIITGFLGAGKTTILANLLRKTEDKRFAILVNEFGEVSVDDAILKRQAGPEQGEFYNFSGGLLAYSGDQRFSETMQELKRRKNLIDHVLIETSGLAVPSAVMEVLQSADLVDTFILDATLTIVDTPVLIASSQDASSDQQFPLLNQVFRLQLECADVVVLNKIDGLVEDELFRCEELIRAKAPSVRFIELAFGAQIDLRVAIGLRLNESTSASSDYRVSAISRSAHQHANKNGHDHSGLGAHEHGLMTHQHLHVHDPGWISFALHSDDMQAGNILKEALGQVVDSERVLRLKGHVWLGNNERVTLVQGVGLRIDMIPEDVSAVVAAVPAFRKTLGEETLGRTAKRHQAMHSHNDRDALHSDVDHIHADDGHLDLLESQLVFIGYHIDRKRVAAKLSELTATTWD